VSDFLAWVGAILLLAFLGIPIAYMALAIVVAVVRAAVVRESQRRPRRRSRPVGRTAYQRRRYEALDRARTLPPIQREAWDVLETQGYQAYLQTEWWAKRRASVLERAGGVCEEPGCEAPATQVHHLTYDRLAAERNSDLMAVCRKHHEEFHGLEW
jgi:hypothetical protein